MTIKGSPCEHTVVDIGASLWAMNVLMQCIYACTNANVWSPHFIKYINSIENLQRHFTKRTRNNMPRWQARWHVESRARRYGSAPDVSRGVSVPRFERPRRSFSSLLGAYFPRSLRSIHRWKRNEKRKLRLADCIHLYWTVLSYKRLFTSTPRRRKIGWSSSACDGGRPYRATTPWDTFFESPCNAQHFIFWQCASILNRLRVIKPYIWNFCKNIKKCNIFGLMGETSGGLPLRTIHVWKALFIHNISYADCMPLSWTV